MQRKVYRLVDGALQPLGNQADDETGAPPPAWLNGADITVQRQLTALVRTGYPLL